MNNLLFILVILKTSSSSTLSSHPLARVEDYVCGSLHVEKRVGEGAAAQAKLN